MIDNDVWWFPWPNHGKRPTGVVHAPKGAILNARILWTFSAGIPFIDESRNIWKRRPVQNATIIDKFYDQGIRGWIYWELDYTGQPVQTKKQIYALGFAIYGLSEYNRATGDKEALDYAIRLFKAIEQYSFDSGKERLYAKPLRKTGN